MCCRRTSSINGGCKGPKWHIPKTLGFDYLIAFFSILYFLSFCLVWSSTNKQTLSWFCFMYVHLSFDQFMCVCACVQCLHLFAVVCATLEWHLHYRYIACCTILYIWVMHWRTLHVVRFYTFEWRLYWGTLHVVPLYFWVMFKLRYIACCTLLYFWVMLALGTLHLTF